MPDTSFDVTRFVNRNGVTSWRVSGWLHGLRFRKNFKTREEAGAERAALDIKAVQADSGVRTTTTRLTDEQLHEAEAAFRRLASAPKSLDFYLDYALTNYRAPEREITLEAAVAAYFGTKQKEHDNGMLSPCQLKDIRIISRRIVEPADWKETVDVEQAAAAAAVETPVYRRDQGLWPHQKYFARLALERHRLGGARLVLADQVGLGKTVQLAMAALLNCAKKSGSCSTPFRWASYCAKGGRNIRPNSPLFLKTMLQTPLKTEAAIIQLCEALRAEIEELRNTAWNAIALKARRAMPSMPCSVPPP